MTGPISARASQAAGLAERCRATPSCTGTILDGYCTVCGKVASALAADASRPITAVTAVATPPTDRPSRSPGPTGSAPTDLSSSAPTGVSSAPTGVGSSPTGSSRPSGGTLGRSATGRTFAMRSTTDLSAATPGRRARSRIGAALVDVPPMPAIDPSTAVMPIPVVPEEKRFCSECGSEIGRTRNGKAGRTEGFCSKCRLPFSFVPALRQGDLVSDQYRVAGCLAYGGLGWIYLATDERVADRWVVLKGLLNTRDPSAMEAALAERRFLARVEHPNVVRIYNFVQHAGAGYIVMEYVGGQTLKDVLKERRRADRGPLPLELAIAYILAILPAFAHLHSLGLIYNDFKPDNVMLQGDDVKLIDLGAVTHLSDRHGVVYGTEGYQAPEVSTVGPSIQSDLYTIGRCLAMLALDLPGYQSTYKHRLPGPSAEPLLARHDSFHRFLLKATAARADDRFQSADEMAEQLHGVLREVVVLNEGASRPIVSNLFGGDLQPLHADSDSLAPDWRHLPQARLNASDPAATLVLNAMLLDSGRQVPVLGELIETGQASPTGEAGFALARALIEIGDFAGAEECLAGIEAVTGREWRITWYRALSLVVQGRPGEAQRLFDYLYSELSGELAPKLALATAAELAGDLDTAGRLYEVVAATDTSYTSASFGLARVRRRQADRAGAVDAYQLIPRTSRLHTLAQLTMARTLIEREGDQLPAADDLVRASAIIERLSLDPAQRAELTAELLEIALQLLLERKAAPSDASLLGAPFQEEPVRLALEQAYRDLARMASGDDKIRLVDRANQVRPMTAA
ncbi:MAG TPA: tetratricopeptide repeat protein [Candidatus Dormibacteraeota bacterium]|nr:tetratricopeptide repeat protein [Candidatus Dormibacteraeota bacterium]